MRAYSDVVASDVVRIAQVVADAENSVTEGAVCNSTLIGAKAHCDDSREPTTARNEQSRMLLWSVPAFFQPCKDKNAGE